MIPRDRVSGRELEQKDDQEYTDDFVTAHYSPYDPKEPYDLEEHRWWYTLDNLARAKRKVSRGHALPPLRPSSCAGCSKLRREEMQSSDDWDGNWRRWYHGLRSPAESDEKLNEGTSAPFPPPGYPLVPHSVGDQKANVLMFAGSKMIEQSEGYPAVIQKVRPVRWPLYARTALIGACCAAGGRPSAVEARRLPERPHRRMH